MSRNTEINELTKSLKLARLTQAWAARHIGVTPGYLNMVFNGKANPSTELLQSIKDLVSQLKISGLSRAV